MSFYTDAQHAAELEQARREFALEMAVERDVAGFESDYDPGTPEEILAVAEKFYDFLCGDEDLAEPEPGVMTVADYHRAFALGNFEPLPLRRTL